MKKHHDQGNCYKRVPLSIWGRMEVGKLEEGRERKLRLEYILWEENQLKVYHNDNEKEVMNLKARK